MRLPIVVLSGGLATRLRPITEKIPKSLIEINELPFVLHQLKLFQKSGFSHVHFCLGYLGKKVKKVIDESIFSKQMKISYSFDGEKLLGTGGAINNALSRLPDIFFVIYGDSYLNIDYQLVEFNFFESASDACGLMTVYKNSNKYDRSNVIFRNSVILRYSKNRITDDTEYIDYGLGILRKKHFKPYVDKKMFDLSEIYEQLSKSNRLLGYEVFNRFYEIGSIKGIEDLTNYLKLIEL